jgi:hypothetical protein
MASSSPERPEFVLFFMDSCNYCKKFINQLNQKPELSKKFNNVNIDTIPNIPDEVDEVPCIYDGKNVYKGTNAFKWLNEKLQEYLSAANDGLSYAFINGQEEQIFDKYSLLEQKNGSFGIGNGSEEDPTRMMKLTDNTNKNASLESLMATRERELK